MIKLCIVHVDSKNEIQTNLTIASPYIDRRANDQLVKFVHFPSENFS
jgi:hypothetical protein